MIGVQGCWVLVSYLFLCNELMVTVLDIYLVCQLAFSTEDHNIPFSMHLKKKLLCTELMYI